MKKLIIFYVMELCIVSMSGFAQETKIFRDDMLIKKWETPNQLMVPESACYDPAANVIYVSNINGEPTAKDGNGFISKLSVDGDILALRWVTGLNAPKGMGIAKGKLYVTDIDRVAEIDIKSMKILRFFDFPGARYLNDIAVDQNGAVYASDVMGTSIYRIYNGSGISWLSDKSITSPNGLFIDKNQLMIGCNKILSVGTADKKIVTWLTDTGSIDGLEGTGDGRYLFSDWQGNVYLVGTDKNIEKILDTTSSNINAADIKYVPSMKMLLVPTFYDNRVMAYGLK